MKGLFEELKNLEMIPLKSLIDKMKNGYSGNQVLEETEYKVSRIETISDGTVNLKKVGFVEKNDKLNEYKLEFGDLLFSNINSLAMVGKTAIFDFEQENLYAGMNLLMIRPKKNVDSKWLYYVINSYYFNQLVKANAKHAINQVSIPTSKIKELPIAYVDYQEQIKIRAYLDAKTSLIDELIKAKENIINKISQQRQSIITEAVTKGLNPNVKMKDLGVEWIGDIPEHWKVTKIKYNTYVKGRIGWQGLKSDEFINEGPYLVTGTDFKHGYVNWSTCYHISEERYEEAPPIQLRENDLLITKDGTIGKLAIVKDMPYRAILNSGVFITRPLNNQYLSKYMYWLLSSNVFNKYISLMETGSTIKHLYQETFVNFSYPIPSLKEQGEIVEYLNIKISEIDKIGQLVKEQIEKLKEYRQALIYEAVTGKIDVRDMELD
ncbi:restriction endonuclease subunit S [Exiguobacterium aurantiacum]|uniref:restriction endonuclease subunit S n=1 Tax=Exiguobacterium aurantiacum TaxID=33987 RepID=UPI001E2EA4AB|nr:restriction endonuclease subunit S [Exiguobacterium aurantiacum]